MHLIHIARPTVNRLAALVAAVIASASFTAPAASQGVEMRYRLEAGKTYSVVSKDHQTVKSTSFGVEQTEIRRFEAEYRFQVGSVDTDGSHRITGRLSRLVVHFDSPNLPIDLDTDRDAATDDVIASILRAAIDAPFTFTLSDLGAVSDVKGLDEVIDRIREGVNPGDPAAGVGLLLLEQGFSDEAVAGVLYGILPRFPREPTEVGGTWTTIETLAIAAGQQKVTSNTTLTAADGQTLHLTGTVNMEPTGDVKPMVIPGGLEMVADLAGEGRGETQADARTGWIKQSTSTTHFKGVIEVFGDQLPEALEIPTDIRSETTVTGSVAE